MRSGNAIVASVLAAMIALMAYQALAMHTITGELRGLAATRDHSLRVTQPVEIEMPPKKLLRFRKTLRDGSTVELEWEWDCSDEDLQAAFDAWKRVCEAAGG